MNTIFPNGQWIWTTDESPNLYVAFVQTVPLSPNSGTVGIRITASSHYELYINGDFVSRGPVYGDPLWCLYDELTYTPAPNAEQLHIVVVVHNSHGTPILALRPAPGGLLASFTVADQTFGTDETWKSIRLPMWRDDAPQRGWALDYCEDYDATLEPEGWQEKVIPSAVVDSAPNAILVSHPESIWANYEARPTPYLKYDFIEPTHFSTWEAPGTGAAAMGDVSQYCDNEPLIPIDTHQSFDYAAVNATTQRANAFTFELGRECIGHYEVEIEAPEGRILEISGVELLRDGRPWIVRKGTGYAMRYRTRAGRQRFRSFAWSGFRYLHLVVRGGMDGVQIRFVACRQRTIPLPPAISYTAPNTTLQQIYDLCRRTLEVGVQEHLIDCPTREQAQYWGDALFIAQSLWKGFQEPRYLTWYLDCFLHVPFNSIGQISSVYPGNHAIFLDYSLIPIHGQRFHKANTGSFYRVAESCDKALRLKAWYDARCDAQGLVQSVAQETIGEFGVVNFIDHPGLGWHDFPHVGIDRDGISCPLNLFFYNYLMVLSEMLYDAERHSEGAAVHLQAEQLGNTLYEQFYDGTVFHDARKEGRLSEGTSWQVNSLAVYFGLLQGDSARRAMQAMLDSYDSLCRCSPYFHFYFLFALRQVGLEKEALQLIQREWQPMLDGDATTTWEGFAGDEKDSLCHPWSTPPFLFLIEK